MKAFKRLSVSSKLYQVSDFPAKKLLLPTMARAKLFKYFCLAIIFAGLSAIFFAIANLPATIFDWKFGVILILSLTLVPRMSLVMPRSNFSISFAESMIYLTFLYFGSETAILLSALLALCDLLYLKSKDFYLSSSGLLYNISALAFSTFFATTTVKLSASLIGIRLDSLNTSNLIIALTILGFSHLLSNSILASIFYCLKSDTIFLRTLKNTFVSASISQIAGAGLAGLTYKVIQLADFWVAKICLIAFLAVYFNYRRIIREMSDSIEKAERAEREKAEAEKRRAEEAEKYASELKMLLKIEEDTNKALQKSRKEFQYAAMHDPLTKLPNRAYFAKILKELVSENKERQFSDSFTLFIDFSRFKSINDRLGHVIGDKVLMLAAKRFLKILRPGDTVARLGGDEFAVIIRDISSTQKAEKVAWKIHQILSFPFKLSGNKINIGINIGIAPVEPDYENPEDVLRDADIAMHQAKRRGSGVEVFNKELRAQSIQFAQIVSDLPFAVERNELVLHYQPIISLGDGSLIGFEALLRWYHRERGFISPAEFIPIAEETGYIVPITTWILKTTCFELNKWQKISHLTSELMVSVNISGKHLSFQSLLIDVEEALEKAQVSPGSLKLEITESAAIENVEQTIRMLSSLKSLGVQLSIDDFGTGYSSLSYLHRLPFDTIKIDRSFVNLVGERGEDSGILETIISLAKSLRMRVIAEGIETENQLTVLRHLGCDYGQGYLISRPLPAEHIETLLCQENSWLPFFKFSK
jgi:diguanylate cyclase (GGDEF)-like protein